MFKPSTRLLALLLGMLVFVGTATATQINDPANGFLGGDGLFCDADGCELLNQNGDSLGKFTQDEIQSALNTCAEQAGNVIIGTLDATYGPFTLSAVYDGPDANPHCTLQVNGFEGEGKQARPQVFVPMEDGKYWPIPISVAEPQVTPIGTPGN